MSNAFNVIKDNMSKDESELYDKCVSSIKDFINVTRDKEENSEYLGKIIIDSNKRKIIIISRSDIYLGLKMDYKCVSSIKDFINFTRDKEENKEENNEYLGKIMIISRSNIYLGLKKDYCFEMICDHINVEAYLINVDFKNFEFVD